MDYFVKYEWFTQGSLCGKAGVVVSADNIINALTTKVPEIVGQFAQHGLLVQDAEEKITIHTIVPLQKFPSETIR